MREIKVEDLNVKALLYAQDRARSLVVNPALGALGEAYAEIAKLAILNYLNYENHDFLWEGKKLDGTP